MSGYILDSISSSRWLLAVILCAFVLIGAIHDGLAQNVDVDPIIDDDIVIVPGAPTATPTQRGIIIAPTRIIKRTSTPTPTNTPTPVPARLILAGHRIVWDQMPGLIDSGDGVINPGETIGIAVRLTNQTNTPIENLRLSLYTSDSNVTLVSDLLYWDRIGPGETVESINSVEAEISPSIDFFTSIAFYLTTYGGVAVSSIGSFELCVLPSINIGPQSGNGLGPAGIAFVPETSRLYVTNSLSGNVSVVTRRVSASIPTDPDPGPILYDSQSQRLYVGHTSAPRITIIDPLQDAVIQTIDIPDADSVDDLAISKKKNFLFVAHKEKGRISILDLNTYELLTVMNDFSRVSSIVFLESRSILAVLDAETDLLALVYLEKEEIRWVPVEGEIGGDTLLADDQNGVIYFGGQQKEREGIYKVSIPNETIGFISADRFDSRKVNGLALDAETNRLFVSLVETSGDSVNLAAVDPETGSILELTKSTRRFTSLFSLPPASAERLYALDSYEHRLAVFDRNTIEEPIDTITLGNTPYQAVADAAQGRVYVTHHDTTLLTSIDTVSMRLLETLDVNQRLGGIDFDSNANLAYAAQRDKGSVLELAVEGALRPIRRFEVGNDPTAIAVDSIHKRIIAICPFSDRVYLIDRGSDRDSSVLPIEAGHRPIGAAVNENDGLFYVITQGSLDEGLPSELIAFDIQKGTIISRIQLDSKNPPASIAFDSRTNRIFVSFYAAHEVWIFNPFSAGIADNSHQTLSIGESAGSVAVDSKRRRLYVLMPEVNQMRVFDLDQLNPIRDADVGRYPSGLAVDEESARVYVTALVGGALCVYQDQGSVDTTFPAPSWIVARAGDSQVHVTWASVQDAVGYIVERSRTGLTSFVSLTSRQISVDSTDYIDTDVKNGLEYRYQVKAVGPGKVISEAVISDPVTPQIEESTLLVIDRQKTHVRVFPGETGQFSISLNAKLGFSDTLDFELTCKDYKNCEDHPRIDSVRISSPNTRLAPTINIPSISDIVLNIQTTSDLITIYVTVANTPRTYEMIPLQLIVSSGRVEDRIPLLLEIIPPPSAAISNINLIRENLILKKDERILPISITTDWAPGGMIGRVVTINGELNAPVSDTAIDLVIHKPDGQELNLRGVLLEDRQFAASLPILNAGDEGIWKAEASFGGNDLVSAGQSAVYHLPVQSGAGGRKLTANVVRPQAAESEFILGKALIASGPPSTLRSREFTLTFMERIGALLMERRFPQDAMRLFSAADDSGVMETPALGNLLQAIEESAGADYLILYLMADVNSNGQLILNETETLPPDTFNATLTAAHGTKPALIVLDGYRANAFIEQLDTAGRVLIASTGSGEMNIAIFGEFIDGTQLSFSNFLFDAIDLGNSVEDSFALAMDQIVALQGPFVVQAPRLYVGDEALADLPVGSAVDKPLEELSDRIPPVITELNTTGSLETSQDSLLLQVEVSDNREAQSVTVILGETGAGNEKVIPLIKGEGPGLFSLNLTPADLPPMAPDQDIIPAAIIAADTSGNLSEPALISISVGEGLTWIMNWMEM